MDVKHITTTRAKLDDLPIANGQLIYLIDEGAAYYDMDNTRYAVGGLQIVNGLPSTGSPGLLYVDTTATPRAIYLWDDTESEFVAANGPVATTADFGVVKPDGSSITVTNGIISSLFGTAEQTKLSGISDGATATSFTQSLTSGTAVGTLTIDGTPTVLYAPNPGASSVTGVKGDSETDYRTGNVNITKANIGLNLVGNFLAVSTAANQGLSTLEKQNARANIEANGTSFTQTVTSGTELGTITIDGVGTKIYAPSGGAVTGVKGNSESTYRTGDVNITKANIGLSNVPNPTIATATLTAGATSLAISNSAITTSSKLFLMSTDPKLGYSNAVVTTGKVTYTFAAQSAAKSFVLYIF